jgi:hypothetical protein
MLEGHHFFWVVVFRQFTLSNERRMVMLSTRGDAHKFYKKLRKAKKHDKIKNLQELTELQDIMNFYEQLETGDLLKIKYKMEKEQNGSGILPLLISALPWLLFIFSKQLQTWLLQDKSYTLLWVFIFSYLSFIVLGVIIHLREKSWASVHINILEDIIGERDGQ